MRENRKLQFLERLAQYPPVVFDVWCTPSVVDVGQGFDCGYIAPYADRVFLVMGPPEEPGCSDEDCCKDRTDQPIEALQKGSAFRGGNHKDVPGGTVCKWTYWKSGKYSVKAIGYKKGYQPAIASTDVYVRALEAFTQSELEFLTGLDVAVVSKETAVITITRRVEIIRDKHAGLGETSEQYTRDVYTLQEGERIVGEPSWRPESMGSVRSGPRVWNDDGTVKFQVTLASGPLFDRWRGWAKGDVVITVANDQPRARILVSNLSVTSPGRSLIAKGSVPDEARYEVKDAAGVRIMEAPAGQSVPIRKPGVNVALEVEAAEDAVFLVVEPLRQDSAARDWRDKDASDP